MSGESLRGTQLQLKAYKWHFRKYTRQLIAQELPHQANPHWLSLKTPYTTMSLVGRALFPNLCHH